MSPFGSGEAHQPSEMQGHKHTFKVTGRVADPLKQVKRGQFKVYAFFLK